MHLLWRRMVELAGGGDLAARMLALYNPPPLLAGCSCALGRLLADPDIDEDALVGAFLRAPLYATDYKRGFGALYTAVYRPAERGVEYRWLGARWPQALGRFTEATRTVTLRGCRDGRVRAGPG